MLKNIVAIGAAFALLAPVSLPAPARAESSGVQLAQMQYQQERMRSPRERMDPGRSMEGGGGDPMRQIMNNFDKCNTMMKQFDDAKSTNAKALALRKTAEEHCGGTSIQTTQMGVSEMRDALKMIGVKPAYD